MSSLSPGQIAKFPFTLPQAASGTLSLKLFIDDTETALDSGDVSEVDAVPGMTLSYFGTIPLPDSIALGSVCRAALLDGTTVKKWFRLGTIEATNDEVKAASERYAAVGLFYKRAASPAAQLLIAPGVPINDTVYFVITRSEGDKYWNSSSQAWEANPTWGDVDLPADEFVGFKFATLSGGTTIPSVAEPKMVIELRVQSGGSPDVDDTILATLSGSWDGNDITEITKTVLGNKVDDNATAIAAVQSATDSITGTLLDVEESSVANERTAFVHRRAGGLVDKSPIRLTVNDEDLLCAIDFSHDLAAGGRVASLVELSIVSTTATDSGLVLASATRRGSQLKFLATAIPGTGESITGEYIVRARVQYFGSDGTATAIVRVTVAEGA